MKIEDLFRLCDSEKKENSFLNSILCASDILNHYLHYFLVYMTSVHDQVLKVGSFFIVSP